MLKLKLSDTEGNVHSINFPETLSELPYDRKIDFDVAVEDIAIWAKQCQEDEGDSDKFFKHQGYYCYLLCRVVSSYTGYDFNQVMKFDVSDLIDTHGDLSPYVMEEHSKNKGKKINLNSSELTLYKLYRQAVNVIHDYKFEYRNDDDFRFKHNGIIWGIPRVIHTLYDGRKIYTKFSTQQGVETLMIRTFLDEKINNRDKNNLSSDEVANSRFTAHLNLIAISVNKYEDGKVKSLLLDENEFDREVAERVVLFQDIDTKTAQDVVFFLTNITNNKNPTLKTSTILKPLLVKRQMR